MKKIILFGATGSIGNQTLDIIRKHPTEFKLVAFAFGHNTKLAQEIIDEFKPQLVASSFNDALAQIKGVSTTNCLTDLLAIDEENLVVVNALVGSVGLIPTMKTLEKGLPLLLANKESLVMAGPLVRTYLEKGATIIPIDSEHSALWDLIKTHGASIKNFYITASGGALRSYPLEKIPLATKSEVLNHPNWQMGAKITVDSATMMNKVFEVWEAHFLFNYELDQIHALVDEKSIVHALVELEDGCVYAHVAKNDMHLPIEYALKFPNSPSYNECKLCFNSLDEAKNYFALKELDLTRYPLFQLTKQDLKQKPFYSVVANAANEALVEAFLSNQIAYGDISNTIFKMLEKYQDLDAPYDLEHILQVNEFIKEEVLKQC